jgi:hypothetical protein
MNEINPSELAAKYAEMSDEGLAGLLAEGRDSYENFAWNILTAEARKRGIPEPPASAPDLPRPEPEEEVAVFSTNEMIEADVVRGFLEANGIEVLSYGETSTIPHPLLRAKTDGIKLIVRRSEFEKARSIIRECQTSREKPPDGSAES